MTNSELFIPSALEDFRPGNANDESKQASEKMLAETLKSGKCDDSGTMCMAPVENYGKLDRFLMPSQMYIPWTEPTVRELASGDVISQKGTTQRLELRGGTTIEVNGDGTYAVFDAKGNRVEPSIILIKPTPGNEPRGLNLSFGDVASAEIVDGRMEIRTRDGANVIVDSHGFASISRPESLRLPYRDNRKG